MNEDELLKTLETLTISQEKRIEETFKTVQHLDAKINALSISINIILAKTQDLSPESAQTFSMKVLEDSLNLKLQKLVHLYG